MLFNKINMVSEIVDTNFLVTRKYFKIPRRITSEANGHTYGSCRSVLIEFIIAQVIGIEWKRCNYINSVFEVNLKTCFSINELGGYQETLGE